MLYKSILKPLLFKLDPEYVHDQMTARGVFLGDHLITRSFVDAVYNYHGSPISKTVDGITYRTPFLLSAGFDYNGQLSRILPHIGFGGEEMGSVTARACLGNAKPRLTRLPKSKSILVNKGLRNEGVESLIARLKTIPHESVDGIDFVTGISIAKTNDHLCADVKKAIDDYATSYGLLTRANVGDYYTINIPWHQCDSLLKVADTFNVNGVVIGNLNKEYSSLDFREEAPHEFKGGLSGKPCTHLSTDLIYKTREQFGKRFTIIGVGGVMSPNTALEKFDAGADLVQLITGMIYEGPGLIKKLCMAYAERGRAI